MDSGNLDFEWALMCAMHGGYGPDGSRLIAALQKLAADAIEHAEHGNYCSGNTHGSMDEGDVMACRYMAELRERAKALGVSLK
jgi:hypothetical protein